MTEICLKLVRICTWRFCLGALCLLGTAAFPATANDSAHPPLLERTGTLVALFWQNVPSFACTESVTQEKLGKKGKTEYEAESVYDYLALTKSSDEDLTIEELRRPRKSDPNRHDKPPMLGTNGFPTLLLIFHPLYRDNYRFQLEPEEPGEKSQRVSFEHIPGTRSTSAVMIRERIYPLDLRGTAWIDPDSGAVLKISARLSAPMKDINIEQFRIDVAYTRRSFPSEAEERWLPSRAVIELQTALQHWRNTHVYSGYKRFSVESAEEISK
jgi:hypothetical protein